MCGLAGFWAPVGDIDGEQAARLLGAMANAIRHRGPDQEGSWFDVKTGLGFAHRRLSILDLSDAGAQPMQSPCGRFAIVFNGEIYNHLALRAELEELGAAHQWAGHSDTETLLASIRHWGLDEALQRSNGMFAFALWDKQHKQLSLARDRIGEKPLYWGWAGETLVFGSELKALRQHSDFPKAICRSALSQYVAFAYVPAPRSIHPGVYKLEAGCILQISERPPLHPPTKPLRPSDTYQSISIRRYWSLTENTAVAQRDRITDQNDAISQVESALQAAVERQMLADVPLGAFLSGGIDSSLIVSMMQRISDRPVQTYTIGFENKEFDESPYAAAIAEHLGTDHTSMIVTEREAQNVIPQLPEFYDEPFADSSQIPTHLVSKLARETVTVALSGDAGDELFGGYNRYFWGPRIWNRLSWLPVPMRRTLGRAISAVPVGTWDVLGNVGGHKFGIAQTGDKAHKLAERLRHVKSIDDLYRSLVAEWDGSKLVKDTQSGFSSLLDDPLPEAVFPDPIQRMMAQDMRTYLPDDILCKVDRAAMSVSLETRVPFLDTNVISLAARIPQNCKIRGGQGKWVLRQILYKDVPQQLIERPKMGFGIPVGEWLRGPLRSWAEDLLSVKKLSRENLFETGPIRKAWLEHLSGQRDWTHRLWIILMFMAWYDKQISA